MLQNGHCGESFFELREGLHCGFVPQPFGSRFQLGCERCCSGAEAPDESPVKVCKSNEPLEIFDCCGCWRLRVGGPEPAWHEEPGQTRTRSKDRIACAQKSSPGNVKRKCMCDWYLCWCGNFAVFFILFYCFSFTAITIKMLFQCSGSTVTAGTVRAGRLTELNWIPLIERR